MRLRHARCQSDGRQPVSSLALSLVSLPARPTRDHPAASIDATSHVHAQRHVPLREAMRETGKRERTFALPVHVMRTEWQRSDRQPSPVNGARASKTPLRRGRHRGLLGPASRLEA